MTYSELKAFHAVAIEGSVTKASKLLHLTQPSVSTHLKNLVTGSGKSLFRRNGHAMELTEDGRSLFEVTQRLFRAESDAKSILSSNATGFKGTLILGADGPHIALQLIETFRNNFPAVRIKMLLDNAENTWAHLLSLKVDAAILAGAPRDPRVRSKTICNDRLVGLIPRNHVLASRRSVSLEEFVEHPLIFRETGSSTQAVMTELLIDRQLEVVPGLVLGSREAVVEAVARGLGASFLYSREIGMDERYKSIELKGLSHANTSQLACLKKNDANPIVENLFRCIDNSETI